MALVRIALGLVPTIITLMALVPSAESLALTLGVMALVPSAESLAPTLGAVERVPSAESLALTLGKVERVLYAHNFAHITLLMKYAPYVVKKSPQRTQSL